MAESDKYRGGESYLPDEETIALRDATVQIQGTVETRLEALASMEEPWSYRKRQETYGLESTISTPSGPIPRSSYRGRGPVRSVLGKMSSMF